MPNAPTSPLPAAYGTDSLEIARLYDELDCATAGSEVVALPKPFAYIKTLSVK